MSSARSARSGAAPSIAEQAAQVGRRRRRRPSRRRSRRRTAARACRAGTRRRSRRARRAGRRSGSGRGCSPPRTAGRSASQLNGPADSRARPLASVAVTVGRRAGLRRVGAERASVSSIAVDHRRVLRGRPVGVRGRGRRDRRRARPRRGTAPAPNRGLGADRDGGRHAAAGQRPAEVPRDGARPARRARDSPSFR